MKNSIIILSLLITMIGCEKDNPDASLKIESYPMEVGSEWTYDRQIIVNKYESNRWNSMTDIDTLNFISKVWISTDTLLNDTMQVKVFKAQDNSCSWTSNQYSYIDNEGLKTYAYSNAGLIIFPMKTEYWKSFNFQTLTDIRLLTNGELYYENPPTLNIKFPLKINSYWTYRKPSESYSLQIDNKVVGSENLTFIEQDFECLKIKYIYMNNPIYKRINITDWISEEGLIKRLTTIDSVTVTNETGDTLYIAQIQESLILKDLKLK